MLEAETNLKDENRKLIMDRIKLKSILDFQFSGSAAPIHRGRRG